MTVPDTVKRLVERFEEHRDAYRSGRYNETQLRREFLDPFFEALGWDVFNRQNYAEMYKDVIHEDSLEIEGENKAPDYAFRVGGTRKFFVEAKKPAVNIEFNIHPAFQLRRYAWSAKLPLSILTDFEEFAVYDCRVKPIKATRPPPGRVMLLSYRDYIEKWDEIAAIFSREAVLKGSFDQYAEGMKARKGTTEVDDAFLAEIERWRELLARNIALRNPQLSVRELNYAVQMTIDRIVFLRICEDRGIERDEQLKEISHGRDIYQNLLPALPAGGYPLQLRPVPFHEGEGTVQRGRYADARLEDRRQGAAGDPPEPVLPGKPVCVQGDPLGYFGAGLRALPGQGHPADGGTPGEGGGEARSTQGGRRLLHAHLHRGLHRAEHGRANCWKARRPRRLPS